MRLSIVVMVILGVGIGWLWWSQQRSTASPAWQGYAEADYVKVAPIEQGQLTAISVARGDQIARGAALFTQDDTHERAARDQAAPQLAQAEEQLANLEAAMNPTEVAQAEANLTDARSTLERARADLQRDEALLRTGYSTAQTVDQRRADYKSAEAKAQHAEAALREWVWPGERTSSPDTFRADGSKGWRSPLAYCTSQSCCCSTSPPPGSMPKPVASSGISFTTWRAKV
jgi:HlyD family secretion protein